MNTVRQGTLVRGHHASPSVPSGAAVPVRLNAYYLGGIDFGAPEAKGVADRLRTEESMKREIKNRKAAIKKLEQQLKAAKGDEKDKIQDLIQKSKEKIKKLERGIKVKRERVAKRKRFWQRAAIRTSTRSFSGFTPSDFSAGQDDEMAGLGDYWNQYTDWWGQQNLIVKIAVPGLFAFGAYKAFPHVKKLIGRK